MLRRKAVELERDTLHLLQPLGPDELAGLVEIDVLVVPFVRLGRGSEDRLRQPVGFAQPGRERVAGGRARRLVVLPA
jgi:hypothetical protein